MSKYKIGDTIHLFDHQKGVRGGGQIYQIVGKNKHFLFLSYQTLYGGYSISAEVTVIPIAEVEKEKHVQ